MFTSCIKFTNKIFPLDFEYHINDINETPDNIEVKNIYKLKIKISYIDDNINNTLDNEKDINQYIIIKIIKNNFPIVSENIKINNNTNEAYYGAINVGLQRAISYNIENIYVEIYSLSILELMRNIDKDKTKMAKNVKINIKKFNKINFGVPMSD
jgi:hypothetical protein